MPLHSLGFPVLEPFHIRTGLDEELHLHLLKFTRAENEIPRRDFVSESFSDLRNSKRNFLPRGLLNIQEVHVRSLRSFRPQINNCRGVFHRTHERLEHEIEQTRCTQRSLHSTRGALSVGSSGRALDLGIVSAKSFFAVAAIDKRIDKPADVTARFPHPWMHQDCRIQAFDVVALTDHRVPPSILKISLQLDAERTVIPHGTGSTVDLG